MRRNFDYTFLMALEEIWWFVMTFGDLWYGDDFMTVLTVSCTVEGWGLWTEGPIAKLEHKSKHTKKMSLTGGRQTEQGLINFNCRK